MCEAESLIKLKGKRKRRELLNQTALVVLSLLQSVNCVALFQAARKVISMTHTAMFRITLFDTDIDHLIKNFFLIYR